MHVLAKNYPDNCFPMMGLHPCSVKDDFDYSGVLKKVQDREEGGGADYDLMQYDNVIYPDGGHLMWLCDVTKFVFNGQLPDNIYFKDLN